jgi:PPOX class probable FMN-dependent enzyme
MDGFMDLDQSLLVRSLSELEAMYDAPLERSIRKQMDRLDDHSRALIAASPLLILATTGVRADNSPRGDHPGFVQVADDRTLLIPDRRGNNRLDSLRNIVTDPRVGLLFLIPGVTETFRVNGEAVISRDPALLERFNVHGKLPRTVIVVKVLEAYMQCPRALVRSDLWNPNRFAAPGAVPTMGTILAAHTNGFVDAAQMDEENKTRISATLY